MVKKTERKIRYLVLRYLKKVKNFEVLNLHTIASFLNLETPELIAVIEKLKAQTKVFYQIEGDLIFDVITKKKKASRDMWFFFADKENFPKE